MKKINPWLFLCFGLYPLGLYQLGVGEVKLKKEMLILSVITLSLWAILYVIHLLTLLNLLITLLFILVPYFLGRFGHLIFSED
ncbi:nitrate reductase NapE component [Natronobacillus azotifigens]|uniref:Uncharacterized protein n=1 Tax=Natronobacillus azotifigens TaxID=472978 RepID=A0A9J6R9U9_9BACI|nr:hypothetical protein [Natronobacillus azotifigens]MCZ0702083.1 hypothetical protein [Natronobacillus azotifigens]